MAPYDVFLSHATPDDSAVKELVRQLEPVGLKLFIAMWDVAPGEPWREAIGEALAKSRTFVVTIGPSDLGRWQRELIQAALFKWERDRRYRVIPVLLPGASEAELYLFPRQLAVLDFRRGLDDPVAFRRLIAAIKTPETQVDLAPPAPIFPRTPLPPSPPLPTPPRTTRTEGIPPLPRSRHLPTFRLPQFRFRPRLKDVWLATAAPPQVARNTNFVAGFSAYTEDYRSQVTKAVIAEAPETKLHLDLHTCQWEPGTKVTVTLSAGPLRIEDPSQSFVWNGKWEILKFDLSVPGTIDEGKLILRFDVFVEGLKIAKLRPELKIVHSQTAQQEERELATTKAPNKAFASYASLDRQEVFSRIRSLQIFTRVEVFVDCLSIHPGERWKNKIKAEIEGRDIFWLFWSQNAMQSEWVDWEWRTALIAKSLDYIQPHPLESPDVAPPPAELAELQFGTFYESYFSQAKSSWWHRRAAQGRKAARRAVGLVTSYWLPASLLLAVVYFVWFR